MLETIVRHFNGGGFKELGHSLAVLGLILHGSSGLYAKCAGGGPIPRSGPRVMTHPFLATSAHPVEMSLYFFVGICLSSFFPRSFRHGSSSLCPWGVLAGALCVAHHALGVAAAWLIGMPTSACVGSCAAVLGAVAVGWALLDDQLWSSSMGLVALLLVILGLVGACGCNELARHLRACEARSPLLPFRAEGAWRRASLASRAGGLLLAAVGGLAGGACLVPWHLEEALAGPQGLSGFLESFGGSVLLLGGGPCACYLALHGEGGKPLGDRLQAVRCPVLAGIMWSMGNGAALIAARHLGYAASYAVFHCQVAVAVFWNLTLFGEVSVRAVPVFVSSAVVLSTGIAILLMVVHV